MGALFGRTTLLCTGALVLACSSSPTPPSVSDRDATSCAPDIFGGSPSPSLRRIEELADVRVLVNASTEVRACFYRDLERPAERGAIAWTTADPLIATAAPLNGPVTRIFGNSFGRTTLTAVITGEPVSVIVRVCRDVFTCPA